MATSSETRRLRAVALLETVSFLVLLVMMFLQSEGGISVVGLIHGLLFMAYALFVLIDREHLGWSWGFVAVAILTGPIGAIVVLERLRKQPV